MAFIGGYELASNLKERIYRANEKEKTVESDDIYTASKQKDKLYGFDEKYVISNNDADHSLKFGTYSGSNGSYFTIAYGETNNSLVVVKGNYENDETQEYTMSFAGKVVDVYYGQFKNDPNYSALFYLLDNGDVCYSYIEDMVKDSEYGFYTTIENLSKIVKFYNGESCDTETNVCGTTTYAQANDGIIYDLSDYIK